MFVEQLWMRNQPLTDLAPFANLRCLRTLGIANAGVTDLSPLASLTRLRQPISRRLPTAPLRPVADRYPGASDRRMVWSP